MGSQSELVAIDCRLFRSTGIGRYIREVVPRVVSSFGGLRFRLIGGRDLVEWLDGRLDGADVEVVSGGARVFRFREQCLYRKWAKEASVLWCTHFNVPWRSRVSLVVNVHDLIPLHVAKGMKGQMRRMGASLYLRLVRRQARAVLNLSQSVTEELVTELGFARNRLHPIPLGVGDEWFDPIPAGSGSLEPLGKYVVYVGNFSPHKNVEALLEAFIEIRDRCEHRLVLLGEKRGFTGHGRFDHLVRQLGPRIEFRRNLTDLQLRQLVAGADLLVQPSLEEGFGLPPLEAMAVGCPVLTSDCRALLETAAQGAHRFGLMKRGDLAQQLLSLLTNDELRRSKIGEGRAWVRRFTWERTAAATADVLRRVLSS